VILRLPDLRPLRCQLRWSDSYNAGVSFELALSLPELVAWAETRARQVSRAAEIIELDEFIDQASSV